MVCCYAIVARYICLPPEVLHLFPHQWHIRLYICKYALYVLSGDGHEFGTCTIIHTKGGFTILFNHCMLLCGDNCTHRNCNTVVVLISFLLPHHTSIHWPLTYHIYHWPLSFPLVYWHFWRLFRSTLHSSSMTSFICLFQSPSLVQSAKGSSWRICRWRVPLQCYVIP